MIDVDIRLEMAGGYVTAEIGGEIDMANVESLRTALLRGLSNDARGALIDFSRTEYIDSAGINLIFQLRDRLRTRGQELRLVIPADSPIADALRYAGVLEALHISESRAEALGA